MPACPPDKGGRNKDITFSLRENLVFVELIAFALVEGEKMICEVNLPRNEKRGDTQPWWLRGRGLV